MIIEWAKRVVLPWTDLFVHLGGNYWSSLSSPTHAGCFSSQPIKKSWQQPAILGYRKSCQQTIFPLGKLAKRPGYVRTKCRSINGISRTGGKRDRYINEFLPFCSGEVEANLRRFQFCLQLRTHRFTGFPYRTSLSRLWRISEGITFFGVSLPKITSQVEAKALSKIQFMIPFVLSREEWNWRTFTNWLVRSVEV